MRHPWKFFSPTNWSPHSCSVKHFNYSFVSSCLMVQWEILYACTITFSPCLTLLPGLPHLSGGSNPNRISGVNNHPECLSSSWRPTVISGTCICAKIGFQALFFHRHAAAVWLIKGALDSHGDPADHQRACCEAMLREVGEALRIHVS